MQGRADEIDFFTLLDFWRSELTTDEIAKKLGISRSRLFLLARKHKLASRKIRRIVRPRTVDPTPEEIIERAARIRAEWSESEEKRRRRGRLDVVTWSVPSYTYDTQEKSFKRQK